MLVILFRHGHKDFEPVEDPPLSPKGLEQAVKLAEFVASAKLPHPTHCWFSEKIRTFQTLEKVILATGCKKEKSPDLNVHSQRENGAQFRGRVQRVLNQFDLFAQQAQHASDIHFVCTHYDWIEEAMTLINCDKNLTSFEYTSWAPAQFLAFEIDAGLWQLTQKGVV